MVFFSGYCTMGSRIGALARKIRLAMTVVVESDITHYSLDHLILTEQFSLFGLSVSSSRNIFHS